MPEEWQKSWHVGPSKEYLEPIGQITVFGGQVDMLVCAIFWNYSGLSPEIGRCITGDLKTPAMLSMIKRMLDVRQADAGQISDFDSLSKEISAITQERNKITHWEWGVGTSGGQISNHFIGKDRSKTQITVYTVEELRDLAEKYYRVYSRLLDHLVVDEVRQIIPKEFHGFFPAPWLDR